MGSRSSDMNTTSNTKESIWTVGHSTLLMEQFLNVLASFDIQLLVDVRSFPGSRRYPHFNRDNLRDSLSAAGVVYLHMPELGGRRKTRPDSQNVAWRNESFRGYADYMETAAFHEGIEHLMKLASEQRTAIMCAEAVWWRCHRSLIADYLKTAGVAVIHILAEGKSQEHPYTSAAQIVKGKLSYRGVLESHE